MWSKRAAAKLARHKERGMEIKIAVEQDGTFGVYWPKGKMPLATALGLLELAKDALLGDAKRDAEAQRVQPARGIDLSTLTRRHG